jgi:hypothetical protein
MIIQDIRRGDGVCLIDPLGNTAEKLLAYIPRHRTEHVQYFNVADFAKPLGLNILAGHDPAYRHRAVAAVVDVFSSICDLSLARTPQLLDVLSNAVAALVEVPDATLLHLPRFLLDDGYRARIVLRLADPGVRAYWQSDFGSRSPRERRDMCSSVLNKVNELRREAVMRNIFGQERCAIDAAALMAKRHILIVNLAKAEIGRENARLIGAFVVSRIVLAAAARMQELARREQDDPLAAIEEFPDFYVYAEEFQDLATTKFDEALSQSRNGRVSFALFNQFQSQLSDRVRDALFGNVGSLMAFSSSASDAEHLSAEFDLHLSPAQLTGLRQHEIAVKLPKRPGNPAYPFRAFTLPLDMRNYGPRRRANIIEQSRMRFGRSREKVEEAINPFLSASDRSALRPPRAKRQPAKHSIQPIVVTLAPELRLALSDPQKSKRAALTQPTIPTTYDTRL